MESGFVHLVFLNNDELTNSSALFFRHEPFLACLFFREEIFLRYASLEL